MKREELFTTPLWRTTLPESIDIQWLIDLARSEQSKNNTLNDCNGWQTHTSGKLMQYMLPIPAGIELQGFLDEQMNSIAQEIGLENIQLLNYWVNINPPGSYNELHQHLNSILVGNIYLEVPKDSGDIEFIRNDESKYYTSRYESNKNSVLAHKYEFFPKVRELVIFPGWLTHGVKLNNSDSDRISFSFNYGAV